MGGVTPGASGWIHAFLEMTPLRCGTVLLLTTLAIYIVQAYSNPVFLFLNKVKGVFLQNFEPISDVLKPYHPVFEYISGLLGFSMLE